MEEHWKGQFAFAPDKLYDGDLALFKRDYPEEDDEATNTLCFDYSPTLYWAQLQEQSRSCNTAAHNSTQQNLLQAAGTFQPTPPVASTAMSGPSTPLHHVFYPAISSTASDIIDQNSPPQYKNRFLSDTKRELHYTIPNLTSLQDLRQIQLSIQADEGCLTMVKKMRYSYLPDRVSFEVAGAFTLNQCLRTLG